MVKRIMIVTIALALVLTLGAVPAAANVGTARNIAFEDGNDFTQLTDMVIWVSPSVNRHYVTGVSLNLVSLEPDQFSTDTVFLYGITHSVVTIPAEVLAAHSYEGANPVILTFNSGRVSGLGTRLYNFETVEASE